MTIKSSLGKYAGRSEMVKNLRLPGLVQWFPFLDYSLLNRTLKVLRILKVKELRTCFSWADWDRPGGKEWLNDMINECRKAGIALYPSMFYTPRRCALLLSGACQNDVSTAHPPANPAEYATFVEEVTDAFGDAFNWVMLWNEPNNTAYWRSDLDPDGKIFVGMMRWAMRALKARNKKIVIGSLVPPYEPWIKQMRHCGLLEQADAVGVHDFPGTWNDNKRIWKGWPTTINEVRNLLYPNQEVWITETGYSTRSLDVPESVTVQRSMEEGQVRYFEEISQLSDPDRVFWYSLFDQPPGHLTDNEANRPNKPPHDPRADGLGIITHENRPKKLFWKWLEYIKT